MYNLLKIRRTGHVVVEHVNLQEKQYSPNNTSSLTCTWFQYTLNKSSKWYIVYICRVFQKEWSADKFYPYFDVDASLRHITSSLFIPSPFVNIILPTKRWHLKQNGVLRYFVPQVPITGKMLNGYLMFSIKNIVQNVKLIQLWGKNFVPLHFVISKS